MNEAELENKIKGLESQMKDSMAVLWAELKSWTKGQPVSAVVEDVLAKMHLLEDASSVAREQLATLKGKVRTRRTLSRVSLFLSLSRRNPHHFS